MAKEFLTMEQVEEEISTLRESEYVKLARKEWRIRMKRRQTLYQLRALEKRGKELVRQGITLEVLSEIDNLDALDALLTEGESEGFGA